MIGDFLFSQQFFRKRGSCIAYGTNDFKETDIDFLAKTSKNIEIFTKRIIYLSGVAVKLYYYYSIIFQLFVHNNIFNYVSSRKLIA